MAATAPEFGLQDLEDIWQAPAFLEADPARREQMLDAVLTGAFREVAGAEDYTPAAYKAFGEVAATARQRLAAEKSVFETVGEHAGKVGGMLKSFAGDVVTWTAALGEGGGGGAEAGERPVTAGLQEGMRLGVRKRVDEVDALLSRTSGAQKGLRSALEGMRAEIDAGEFPAGEGFDAWLQGHSDRVAGGQDLAWTDRTPEDVGRYSLAADPDARALVAQYITTRNPQAWELLERQLLKTPARRAIERESEGLVRDSPGARWLDTTFGEGMGMHLISASDPVAVASMIAPMARGARGAAAVDAVAGGASTVGQRALGAGKSVAKGMPEQAVYGAEMVLAEDPNAPAGAVAGGALDLMEVGAVLGGVGFGVGEGARAGSRALAERRARRAERAAAAPAEAPVEAGPVEPPVEAPPPGETKPEEAKPEEAKPEAPPPVEVKPEEETAPPPVEPPVEPKPEEAKPAEPAPVEPAGEAPPPGEIKPEERPEEAAPPAEAEPPRGLGPVEALRAVDPRVTAAEARRLLEAQDAKALTDPESVLTLAHQVRLMEEGRKPAVFLDGVGKDELPAAWLPPPTGQNTRRAYTVGSGTLLYELGQGVDLKQILPRQLAAGAVKGADWNAAGIGDLLGYGIADKPAGADRAVVVRTGDGHEIVSVAVDDAAEATVVERLTRMMDPGKGDTLTIEPLDLVLADRDTRRRIELEALREPATEPDGEAVVEPTVEAEPTVEPRAEAAPTEVKPAEPAGEPTPVPPVLRAEEAKPEGVKLKSAPTAKVLKEQKQYVISELDKAIAEAGDETPNVPADADLYEIEQTLMPAKFAGEKQAEYDARVAGARAKLVEVWAKYADRLEGVDPTKLAPWDMRDRLRRRLEAVAMEQGRAVIIEVPGDGVFRILNNREALREAKKRLSKLPTSPIKATGPKGAPTSSTNRVPPVGQLKTPEEQAAALHKMVSTDPTREPLQYVWDAGDALVATSGKGMLIVDVKGKAREPGYRDPKTGKRVKGPVDFDDDGKESAKPMAFPETWRDYSKAKSKGTLLESPLDTARLYTLVEQANATDQGPGVVVRLYRNPDGTLGLESQGKRGGSAPDEGEAGYVGYESNVQDGAKFLTALDGQDLSDGLRALRALGHEKVAWLTRADGPTVAVGDSAYFDAPGVRLVLSPFKVEVTEPQQKIAAGLERVEQKATKGKGKGKGRSSETAAHGGAAAAPRLPAGPAPAAAAGAAADAKPIGLTEIRQFLLDKIGLPAVGVRRFRQRALGIYKLRPVVIRLLAINDLPVLAHEIGHHIHARLDPTAPWRKPTTFGKAFDAELLVVGEPTSLPSYTLKQKRMEGVAEFTRRWLTEPATAMAMAPKFAAHFEATLANTDPPLWQALQEGRAMIAQYINQPAWVKLKSHLVFDPPRRRRTVGEFLRGGYARWVNTMQPITDVTKRARQVGMGAAADRVQGWIENHRGGWQSKAYADVMLDQTNLHGDVVGEGLRTILKDLRPEQMEDFSTYIAVRRAMELEMQGRKSGFDFAGATGFQADVAKWAKVFEPTRQKLLVWQENSVKLLYKAGLIGQEEFLVMKRANQEYVPFYRVYEKATGVSMGPETGGKGAVNNGTGIRKLRGSDRAIIDPLESAVKNAFFFRKLAENNRIGSELMDLIEQMHRGGQFGDRIAVRRKPTVVPHKQIMQALVDAGLDDVLDAIPEGADLTFRLWHTVTAPDHKNGEVIVWRNGARVHYQVRDPMLLQALRVSDTETVSLVRHLGPVMTGILTGPARLLRWGATGQPIFALTNWTRDQLTAAVFSKTGFIPFWDGVRGAVRVLARDGMYREWVRSGGRFAGQVTYDLGMRRILEDALPKQPAARRMMAALASPRAWKRGLGLASEILEEATRVQEFARARSRGLGQLEAANLSKEVTLNFARSGAASRLLNQLITFFNAGVQDLDKVVREHADPRTRGRTMLRGLMWITVPSVLAWALGKDDPAIQELPEWRKNFFWNINLHGIAGALGRRGFVLSVPKPFLMGAIYGTAVERALDAATGRDPAGAHKAVRNILQNTVMHGDLINVFSAFTPLVEVKTNFDFFTGRPVVPERLKGLPAAMQFDATTSETARGLGAMLGISPMVIDHLLGGYLAGVGRHGTAAIDWGMAKLGMTEGATPPAKDPFELPLGKAFAPSPYERTVFADRFFKGLKIADGLHEAWKQQAPQLSTDAQAKWWKENGEQVRWYRQVVQGSTGLTRLGRLNKAAQGLGELAKAIRLVRTDRTLSAETKRQRLMDLTEAYNAKARGAFKLLHPETQRKAY